LSELILLGGQTAIVDDADFDRLNQHRWYVGSHGYATRSVHVPGKRNPAAILMHREIVGALPGQFVDHANQVKLDNRRSNLRVCTKRQNQQNSRKRQTYRGQPTKNRLKGAHAINGGRFSARIRDRGKYHYLGTFDTEEQAHAAYCEAADRLHGEFARAG
jgi:HNH endonuclease